MRNTSSIAGIDFPSRFTADNFTSRRTTGHNMYDPDSLITGEEIARGMTYTNSTRSWRNEEHYIQAISGELSPEEIAESAPRMLKSADVKSQGLALGYGL
jgi:hypothetical protein